MLRAKKHNNVTITIATAQLWSCHLSKTKC